MFEDIVINGERDTFKDYIKGILKRGLPDHYIDELTTPEALQVFSYAFTSKRANPDHNYEIFEQLGDVSVNKFVVDYMYHRFPQLRNPGGVDVVGKLKIKYVAMEVLQGLAEELKMWPYITAMDEEKNAPVKRKKLMEDVFEAFFGALEFLLNNYIGEDNGSLNLIGVGYHVNYTILKSLYDNLNISIRYEDLVDAKTRLNELVADQQNALASHGIGSKPLYENRTIIGYNTNETTLSLVDPKRHFKPYHLSNGAADTIKQAQEIAAEEAIALLNQRFGIHKDPPERFVRFYQQKLTTTDRMVVKGKFRLWDF